MALNFGSSSGLFPTSQAADVGFRKTTLIEGVRREEQDVIPDVAPGEIVLWEKGEGQGEFQKVHDAGLGQVDIDSWKGNQFTIGTTTPDGDFTIASLTIFVYKEGNPGTLTIEIKAVDGDGKPTGAVLSSGTTNGDTLTTNTNGETREITMSSTKLSASTMYAWYAKISAGVEGTNHIHMKTDSAAGYSGGVQILTNNSGVAWTVGGDDVYFDIQGGGKFLLTRTTDDDLYQSILTKVP